MTAAGVTLQGHVPVSWGIRIAKQHGATITIVPLFHADYWKESLPLLMNAGYAARFLEMQPWTGPAERVQELQQRLRVLCDAGDIATHFEADDTHSLEGVVSRTALHDLLVLGSDGAYDRAVVPSTWHVVRMVALYGALPMLIVPTAEREIRRVMIAYSGSTASGVALKQFVHLRIWPDAEIELACVADNSETSGSLLHAAGEYLSAHGVSAQFTAMSRDPAAILGRARESRTDLFVAGAGFRRVDRDSSSRAILKALVEERDLPVFIGG